MAKTTDSHWRDSARPVRFFIWDGKTSFPLLLFLLHVKLWTLMVALGAMVFFTILNRYGFTVEVFFRWARSIVAGRRKTAIPFWER